jgi:alpha-D-ribose 1-methylphosphonate 5-phosphate C-P lyase
VRPKLMIILAVILALLATGMCYFYLQNAVEKADQTEKAQVVQARVEIPKDTNITKEMVELVKVPIWQHNCLLINPFKSNKASMTQSCPVLASVLTLI